MRITRKYAKIRISPPGPKARKIIKDDKKFISPSIIRYYPLVVESISNFIVRDVDGNQYIDFNSGLLCLNVGGSNKKVIEAISKQLLKFTHYSYTDFYYELIPKVAREIIEITPGKFDKRVFFSNSGAEAIEAAMKLSRWYRKKPIFMAFIGAFHGRTFGAMSLTASKLVQREGFFPLLPNIYHVPYPYCYRCPLRETYPECGLACVDFIEEQYLSKFVPPGDVAAFFAEPIQGEGGYVVPPPNYFKKLFKLLKKHGILLVIDEIQTGMGRTGKWFAIEHFGVIPDIITIGKAVASGLPLGVTVAKKNIMNWPPGSHATTFGGNPLALAAASAVISEIKDKNLIKNALDQGNYIKKRLNEMMEKYEIIGDVRGLGLMIGLEIVRDKRSKRPGIKEARKIMIRAWKRGLAIILAGRSTIRIAPPLTITREAVDEGIEILEESIKETIER